MAVATDLEGTLTTGETWRALAAWLRANGRGGSFRRFYAARFPAALAARLGARDAAAFRRAWMRDLLALFAGRSEAEFALVARWVVEEALWPARREAVVGALRAHAEAGETVWLASGAYQPVLDAFAARLAAALGGAGVRALGTPVEVDEGRLTGRVAGPVRVGPAKWAQLAEALGDEPLSVAYGDSEADLPMLRAARTAVAVHPDDALRRVAAAEGWTVVTA